MHFKKKYNKEVRTYLQGLRPFKDNLPKKFKSIFKKRGFLYSEILAKWQSIVGDEISKKSYPASLKFVDENSANLILSVKRGDEIQIEYSKNKIIDKINSFFGYDLIKNIKLVTFSKIYEKKLKTNRLLLKNSYNKFESKIKDIKNDNIKIAFLKLINTIKK